MTQFLPQKVNAVLAVSEEEVAKNIRENLRLIPNWFGQLFYPNGYEAIIVSAGPSMEKYIEELNIKERMGNPNRGFVLFCVKHALPRLLAMGITPDFCVILDGRDFELESTHGVHRTELFEEIPHKTVFMVASMTHPGYAKYLTEQGARVLGWHTSVAGIDKFNFNEPIIMGGTSSGTRSISIANAMGIRDITLVGFDSCIHNPTEDQQRELDKKGRPKYIPMDLPVINPSITPEDAPLLEELTESYQNQGFIFQTSLLKRFYTTGELMAQAQDFESLLTAQNFDLRFKVLDDGIVNHMFTNMDNVPKRGFSFIDYVGKLCPKKFNPKSSPKREIIKGTPKGVCNLSSIEV